MKKGCGLVAFILICSGLLVALKDPPQQSGSSGAKSDRRTGGAAPTAVPSESRSESLAKRQAGDAPQPTFVEKTAPEKREPPIDKDKLEREAYLFSQECVKKFLKYPLDADFTWLYDVRGNYATGDFWFHSTVKAKNALGATLTHEWTTQLQRKDGTWHLVSCKLGDELVYVDEKTGEALKALADAVSGKGQAVRKLQPTPEAATRALNAAKRLLQQDKPEMAEKWLREVSEKYPDTKAAKEAAVLLTRIRDKR